MLVDGQKYAVCPHTHHRLKKHSNPFFPQTVIRILKQTRQVIWICYSFHSWVIFQSNLLWVMISYDMFEILNYKKEKPLCPFVLYSLLWCQTMYFFVACTLLWVTLEVFSLGRVPGWFGIGGCSTKRANPQHWCGEAPDTSHSELLPVWQEVGQSDLTALPGETGLRQAANQSAGWFTRRQLCRGCANIFSAWDFNEFAHSLLDDN